jgi:transcriptional regulator with XRE-family HTH domain
MTETTQNGRRKRTELAAFLRSRRERVTPEDVGMPPGPRRRTPGLRREEVAQLAGVGVTWYTWLEQGRPINVSVQVLDAVARTLRLDEAEWAHLYRLAEVPDPGVVGLCVDLPEDMQDILDGLSPRPASVVNGRSDVLAWNDAYAAVFPQLVQAPDGCRNSLWAAFTLPDCCNPLGDMQREAPLHVAVFRYRYSSHLDEPRWRDLVRRLSEASPRFAQLWATQDVALPGPRIKVFQSPSAGEIKTRTTSFDATTDHDMRMVVYTPADDESAKRIQWLLDNPEEAAAAVCHPVAGRACDRVS